jgi:hypothetical protein
MDEAPEGSIENAADKPLRLPAAEKVKRDQQLIRDRLRGAAWGTLAEKYGIDGSTARRIFYAWRQSNHGKKHMDLSGRDPIEIVWETAARYEAWIEQLAEIAWDPDAQDSVRVGAINSQMAATEKLTTLLQATGILPRHLGKLRIEADVRLVAQRILEVFAEEEVPEHVQRRVVGVLSAGSTTSD